MRKALGIIIALAIVVVAVAFIGQRWFTRPKKEPGPAALSESSTRQEQQIITVRGIVVPVRSAKLSFPISGKLQEITATAGITVSAGQVLARLDGQELELDVQLAQSELEAQEANLARLQEGASVAELAAAQVSYEAAVAAYEKLKAGPSAQEITIADADLKQAERALQQAQAAYDAVRGLPDIGARSESLQLERATIDYQRAKAAYELATAGPDQAALKQAESQAAAAKAQLEALQAGAPPSEIRAAQAGVARAEANLARALLAPEQATLRAPFDGMVTSVTVAQPGGLVSPGDTILTIADLTQLQVETMDLDEWGVANVTLNQSADLLVPALGNRSLRGHMAFISPEPTSMSSGAVFYKAIIALEKQEPDLRWGMTVSVKLYMPRGAPISGI